MSGQFIVAFAILFLQTFAQGADNVTILYSEVSSLLDGNRGSRAVSTRYCEGLEMYVDLKCDSAVAYLDYGEGDGFVDFPLRYNVSANLAVVGPTGERLWDDWGGVIRGENPKRAFGEAGVVGEDGGWEGGGGYGCRGERGGERWRTSSACRKGSYVSSSSLTISSEFASCNSLKNVVCVCNGGELLGTPVPTTLSPSSGPVSSSPSVSPTRFPTRLPTVSPSTLAPTSKLPTNSPSVTSPTFVPTTSPTEPYQGSGYYEGAAVIGSVPSTDTYVGSFTAVRASPDTVTEVGSGVLRLERDGEYVFRVSSGTEDADDLECELRNMRLCFGTLVSVGTCYGYSYSSGTGGGDTIGALDVAVPYIRTLTSGTHVRLRHTTSLCVGSSGLEYHYGLGIDFMGSGASEEYLVLRAPYTSGYQVLGMTTSLFVEVDRSGDLSYVGSGEVDVLTSGVYEVGVSFRTSPLVGGGYVEMEVDLVTSSERVLLRYETPTSFGARDLGSTRAISLSSGSTVRFISNWSGGGGGAQTMRVYLRRMRSGAVTYASTSALSLSGSTSPGFHIEWSNLSPTVTSAYVTGSSNRFTFQTAGLYRVYYGFSMELSGVQTASAIRVYVSRPGPRGGYGGSYIALTGVAMNELAMGNTFTLDVTLPLTISFWTTDLGEASVRNYDVFAGSVAFEYLG